MSWPVVALVAVVGAAVGAGSARWLRTRGYRYEDEVDLPARRVGWVALAIPLLLVLVLLSWGEQPIAVVYGVATVVLVLLAAIDIDVWRLPDALTYPLASGLVLALLVVAVLEDDVEGWVRALMAGVTLGCCYLALVLIGSGAGMGLGDAKLAVSLGMLLGYQSWAHVLLGSLAAFLIAGIAAVYLMLFRGAGRKSHLAFGPYLVVGTVLVLVAPAIGTVLQEF